MILPPITQTQRESQIILHQLVYKYSQSQIPQNFKSLFDKYDSQQNVKHEILHLQIYIEKNKENCFSFLKKIFRKQLHLKLNKIFLDIVLILIWMVYSKCDPSSNQLKQSGQSFQSNSNYNKDLSSEKKSQKCRQLLNEENEQSIQLNSIDYQDLQQIISSFAESLQINNSVPEKNIQNGYIGLNEEGDQSFKENSHDVLASNEINQTGQNVGIRSQTSSFEPQKQKQQEIDWNSKIQQFIGNKKDLIKIIIECQQLAENTSYKNILFEKLDYKKSAKEWRREQKWMIAQYKNKVIGYFREYYNKLQSKNKDLFEPQHFYNFIKNYKKYISLLDKDSEQNIFGLQFQTSLLQEIDPDLLKMIGFYHYFRKQYHKAIYYVKWAYKSKPRNPDIAYLYGVSLICIGQLQKAQHVLKGNLKYEKISSGVKLSYVYALQGKSDKVKQQLKNSRQQLQKSFKRQQEQYIQNRNGQRETRPVLLNTKYFYLQTLLVEAYSLIHKKKYEAAIKVLREDNNDDEKKSIYLGWCYYKEEKYREFQFQILKIQENSISKLNPLEYIAYFQQFLNFQNLGQNLRTRLRDLTQRVIQKLKLIRDESLCFARQLFQRKQYTDAYKILKYIDQKFTSLGNQQFTKQLQTYKWKSRIVQFNPQIAKQYSLDEMKRLQNQLKKEGLYEKQALKLGKSYIPHDRCKAAQILKQQLQIHMNLDCLKLFLEHFKQMPQNERPNIDKWLEKNLQNNKQFIDEIHLQRASIYKYQKNYILALIQYEKYLKRMRISKELNVSQQQKLLPDMLECKFNIAMSQQKNALIYQQQIQQQLSKKIGEMEKSKGKVQPNFIRHLRQMLIKKSSQYKDFSIITKEEREMVQMILNLRLRTITYDQIKFCPSKRKFLMTNPKAELLNMVTFSKQQIRVKFLKLIHQFAVFYSLSYHQLIESTIEMLQKQKIPSKNLVIYYNQVGMYQKVISNYRQRLKQQPTIQTELKSQLISVATMKQNVLIILLYSISMQMTSKKNQTIWQIISTKFFNGKQQSEQITKFKTELAARLEELSEFNKQFLAQFTKTILVENL